MFRHLINGLVPVLLGMSLIPGHAQSASEARPVASFSRLSAQDAIDVYLTQQDRESLRVEVEGYDLEDVITEVAGGELRLSREGPMRGGFFGENQIRIYLGFVQLSAIVASGGSDIYAGDAIQLDELAVRASGGSDIDFDVRAASLEFNLSGGSDLHIRGSAPSLTVEASGGSDVSARSFEAERVSLRLSGGSDASVRARDAVEIDAHGGSDVDVHGGPSERSVNNDRSSDVNWR